MSRAPLAIALFVVGATSIGCGESRPSRVPIAGRVVIDGKPVPFGMIKLVKQDTRAAVGMLDSEGRFELSCYEKNDGVVPGTHQVEVAATEGIDDRTTRWHAPKIYASRSTSGIEVTVDKPADDLVIELTWSGGKGPFIEKN